VSHSLLFALLVVKGYMPAHYTALKYKVARDDGHRFYFRVAYYGILLFLVSCIVLSLLYWWLQSYGWFQSAHLLAIEAVRPLMKDPDKAPGQLAFVLICLGSVALGRIVPIAFNRLFHESIYAAAWKSIEDNELEELLMEALNLTKPISITLSSNKVYVGMVLTTPEPRTERLVIALLPLMSGYRTETGKVNFTTFYDLVYKDSEGAESDDFKLVLPIDKMLSLSFFDVATYAKFSATPLATNIPT